MCLGEQKLPSYILVSNEWSVYYYAVFIINDTYVYIYVRQATCATQKMNSSLCWSFL